MHTQTTNIYKISLRYLITVAIVLVATVCVHGGSASAATQGGWQSGIQLAATDPNYYGLNAAAPSALKNHPSLGTQAGNIIKGLLGFVGIILLILTIYGGFTWMTAGGNEQKVEEAKKIMASATIGFILIFLSYALTVFITNMFFPTASPPNSQPGDLYRCDLPNNGGCINTTQQDCTNKSGIFSSGNFCS